MLHDGFISKRNIKVSEWGRVILKKKHVVQLFWLKTESTICITEPVTTFSKMNLQKYLKKVTKRERKSVVLCF